MMELLLPLADRLGGELVPLLLTLAAKATGILAVAALAAWALRRQAAALRHLAWSCAMLAILLLPLLSLSLPTVPVAVLRSAAPVADGLATRTLPPAVVTAPVGAPVVVAAPAASAAATLEAPAPARASLAGWALLVWASGAAVVLLRLILGQVGVRRIRATAVPVDASFRWLATEMSARLRLRRMVEMLRAGDASMPMTWGVIRPTILLPAEAGEWPEERRRAVLLHELAHVKRLDCLTQTLAQIGCAILWFHPGVWWAAARMRVERETACDDAVLAAGVRPTEYAAQLLEVARAYRPAGLAPLAAIAMARPSQLEGRLLAVLDAARDRAGLSRRAGAVALGAALLALLPLSVLRPVAQAAPPASELARGTSVNQDTLPRRAVPAPRPRIAERALASISVEAEAEMEAMAAAAAETAMSAIDVEAIARSARDAMRHAAPHQERSPADPRVVDGLIVALRDADAEVRRTAAHALGEIGDRRAVEPLTAALRDANAEVRRSAAWALGEIGDPRAAAALGAAVRDGNAEVRRTAIWALSEIGDPAALPGLVAALRDPSAEVRRAAVHALGELDDRRAVEPLIAAVRDASPEVRRGAAHALGEIGDPRALPALRELWKDSVPEVRRAAVMATFEFDDPASVDQLIELLRDPDPQVRRQAARALGDRA